MRSKRILGIFEKLSYHFVFLSLVFACIALAGCKKNCKDYEKELNAYANGSKQIDNYAQVSIECREALGKCPNLAVAFEVLGDIDVKNMDMEEADNNYNKALASTKDKERVNAKRDKIAGAISKARSEAVDAKINSIWRMRLTEYVRLDESMRLTWCEKAINDPIKYVFTDRSMGSSFIPKFSGTPQQLDRFLTEYAEKEPMQQTGAAVKIAFSMSDRQ